MSRSFITSSIVCALVLVACGGSKVVVGETTGQKLQTTKDGGATGDGTRCSWANTSVYDTYGNSAPVPTYALGDEFKSIDGCNECECTARGIMCTVKTCEQKGCTAEALICPDGSSVGRSGPNCSFTPCPGTVACTDDAKKCDDGSFVGREPPNCDFKPCGGGTTDPPIACPDIAKQCPDGSYVGATGPNCEFVCPNDPSQCIAIEDSAAQKLLAVIESNVACNVDGDCINVGVTADCVYRCAKPMAKTGEADLKAVVASLNSSTCLDFAKASCAIDAKACAPSPPARCVDKKCTQ